MAGKMMTGLAVAAAMLLFGGAAAWGDQSSDSEPAEKDPAYAEASALIMKGTFDQAIVLLKEVVGRNDQDADAYNLLGYSHRKLGRYEEALSFYQRALALNPDHRGAHEYIGEAYLALNQPDKAREHLAALDKACWLGCREYSDLKAAIAAHARGEKPPAGSTW